MAEILAASFRDHYGRLVAFLAASCRDVALAEDAVQDAMLAASKSWQLNGTPDNPAAWLHQVARHRLLDRLRRQQVRREHANDVAMSV
ncbi:MAG: RNA polymerase subunit sigma-24, partial [Proteobacteria bacterium]|nr:RNA polymerase subunit sigma-24 [Pseudomonadota bacterium]